MKKTLLSPALITLLAAAGCLPGLPAPPAPKAGSAAASAPTPPAPEDPYPECALVRKWFAENLGDPKSLEVISWKREPYHYDGSFGLNRPDPRAAFDCVRVTAKYRAKNAYGALAVREKVFFIRDDEAFDHLPVR
jgi:hypothetical protein